MRPGERRARLDATLSAAYAQGLLSEDTFASRVEQLMGAGTVRPELLVGDVTLRGGRARWWSRLLARVSCLTRRESPALLALDWSGATETLLVGREDGSDIRLDAPSVSRRHARLMFRDGGWVLHDLGSMNGTTINGAPAVRARLRPGDLVAFAGERLRVD